MTENDVEIYRVIVEISCDKESPAVTPEYLLAFLSAYPEIEITSLAKIRGFVSEEVEDISARVTELSAELERLIGLEDIKQRHRGAIEWHVKAGKVKRRLDKIDDPEIEQVRSSMNVLTHRLLVDVFGVDPSKFADG